MKHCAVASLLLLMPAAAMGSGTDGTDDITCVSVQDALASAAYPSDKNNSKAAVCSFYADRQGDDCETVYELYAQCVCDAANATHNYYFYYSRHLGSEDGGDGSQEQFCAVKSCERFAQALRERDLHDLGQNCGGGGFAWYSIFGAIPLLACLCSLALKDFSKNKAGVQASSVTMTAVSTAANAPSSA